MVRLTKHMFTAFLQSVETISLACAIAHFLNCFLSSCPNPHAAVKNEELLSNKRRRQPPSSTAGQTWASFMPRGLWQRLTTEMQKYYGFTLEAEGVNAALQRYKLQKVTLLRTFCLRCGVQVLLRDYAVDGRQAEAVAKDDIINLQPVMKHANPRASDTLGLYSARQAKTQQGFLKEGYSLIS